MLLILSGSRVSLTSPLRLTFRASLHRHGRLFTSADTQRNQELKSVDDLPGPHSNLTGISLAKKFISDGLKLFVFKQKRADRDQRNRILEAQVRNAQKFGPIFRTKYTGLRPVTNVKISNPSDVATVLRAESRTPLRPDAPAREYYRKKTNKPAGLIFDNGPDWYKHRRGVNERMMKPKNVAEYDTAFSEIVTDFYYQARETSRKPWLGKRGPLSRERALQVVF